MEGSDGFQITHNRAVRNQESGIALGPGSDNVITRNHVSRAGDGIAVAKGHGNLIAHNVVAHTDNGISLGVNGAGPRSGARSVVRRNLVRDSRKDGFFVRNKDRHSRLKGNVAKRSGDDGFDVESRSAKLTEQSGRAKQRPRDRGGARGDRRRREQGERQRRPAPVHAHRV